MARGGVVYKGSSRNAWHVTEAGTTGQVLVSDGASGVGWQSGVGGGSGATGPTGPTGPSGPTGAGEGGGGGHIHGIQRMLGDGSSVTFNLLDYAEYLEHIGVNGAIVDPLTYTLSSDRGQITFDSAPGDGQVIAMEYVVAGA